VWIGVSSVGSSGTLEFGAEDLLERDSDARIRFRLPPIAPRGRHALVVCDKFDDNGDPIGIVDTKGVSSHGIVRAAGRLAFFALPNHVDRQGNPLFMAPSQRNRRGEQVLRVSLREGSKLTEIELPANHTDADGRGWFIRRPNLQEGGKDRPIVFLPLTSA
jgi:hypothetical protein